MAIRKKDYTSSRAKRPSYDKSSKMKRYDIYFDDSSGQTELAFFKRINEIVKTSDADAIFTVEAGYEYRTDLISVKFYGTAKYDWIIEDVNNIRDPLKEVVSGKKLIIPNISKIYSIA